MNANKSAAEKGTPNLKTELRKITRDSPFASEMLRAGLCVLLFAVLWPSGAYAQAQSYTGACADQDPLYTCQHSIQALGDDFQPPIIELEDDSLWEVLPSDAANVLDWTETDDVDVIETSTQGVYILLNTDENEKVYAEYLGQE